MPSPRLGSRISFARICSSRPAGRSVRDQHDPIGLDQARHRLVDRRERHDLRAAGESLQPELRVGLAALRVLPLHRPDDAADRHEVAVAEVLEIADLVRGLRGQESCTPSSGWSVTNWPSISFSSRSRVRLSNSSPSSTDSSTSVTPESPREERELPGGLGLAFGEDGRDTLSWFSIRARRA